MHIPLFFRIHFMSKIWTKSNTSLTSSLVLPSLTLLCHHSQSQVLCHHSQSQVPHLNVNLSSSSSPQLFITSLTITNFLDLFLLKGVVSLVHLDTAEAVRRHMKTLSSSRARNKWHTLNLELPEVWISVTSTMSSIATQIKVSS